MAQEKVPSAAGTGPNTTAGSPFETRPLSAPYPGNVPIGPFGSGSQTSSVTLGSGSPRHASRAEKPVYSGWIHDSPESKENWTPDMPTPGVNGQSFGAPASHASRSMLSFAPAATRNGWFGSIATAGSFCLFCEKIPD